MVVGVALVSLELFTRGVAGMLVLCSADLQHIQNGRFRKVAPRVAGAYQPQSTMQNYRGTASRMSFVEHDARQQSCGRMHVQHAGMVHLACWTQALSTDPMHMVGNSVRWTASFQVKHLGRLACRCVWSASITTA